MRTLWILFLVPLLCFGIAQAQEDGVTTGKKPLDLPAGGVAGDESDEDAPENITFYGQEIEGDGFFFLFPAYAFCGILEEFEDVKDEVTTSVQQLTQRSWFAIAAFNDQPHVLWQRAKLASSGNKAAAVAWMATITATEQKVITEAGLKIIEICNSTKRAHSKNLVFIGGNKPSDGDGALDTLTGANYKRVPIHTVYVASVYSTGGSWWQALAAANGGTFQQVQ